MHQTAYDVFCHATEDKDAVARPLAVALSDVGLAVWYDEFSLKLGDSLRRRGRNFVCHDRAVTQQAVAVDLMRLIVTPEEILEPLEGQEP